MWKKLIAGCSFPAPGQAEEYGEKRICRKCYQPSRGDEEMEEKGFFENWRGEGGPSCKKIKRSKYLSAAPEWEMDTISDMKHKVKIGVLRKRFFPNMKAVNIGKGFSVFFGSTCAFVSVVQALAVAAVDHKGYSSLISNSTDGIVKVAMAP